MTGGENAREYKKYQLTTFTKEHLGAVYKGRPPKSRIFKPPPSPCPSVLNHSNFEIFLKGHPAVELMMDRRIFER